MMRIVSSAVLAAVTLAACGEEPGAPTAPAAPATATAPAEAREPVLAPDAAACPCWTGRSLDAAFPVASFFFEDLSVEAEAGRVVLQLGDIGNARVLQALVEFEPRPAGGFGANWCQVASFGQTGLERESISAIKISSEEFDSCVRLLQYRAGAAGVAKSAD